MRVLFWGASAFGVPSLRALLGEGFEVVGVVTQPDRAHGRSRSHLHATPIKALAMAEGVPAILQPERPRVPEVTAQLSALEPEISVVVSYGHILPAEVIALPERGTVNVHASLLPKLRGAAPIQAAIREGYIETGVTIMRMVAALDAGPVLLQARTPIAEDETAGELELRLSELGALALIEALTLLQLGRSVERAQDDAAATYAGKIEREMARIAWSEGCGTIARFIRAYDPRPGAFTTLRGTEIKLFGALAADDPAAKAGGRAGGRAGAVLRVDAQGMLVACGLGAVQVADVQPAGKRRLTALEWSRGRGVAVGDVLGG